MLWVPNLIAGIYRVEVETQGFKKFIQNNVEVQVDVATRVDAKLQVGNVTESVLVTTEAPPLQTDSASLGTTISQTEVESIPLSGRNVNNMLTLVPGVVAQGGTYGNAVSNQAGGARTNAIGFGNYAIGGGFGNQSSFYIDGVASNALPAISIRSFPLRTWCKNFASSPTMSAPSMVATREESLTSPPSREPTDSMEQHTSTCAIRLQRERLLLESGRACSRAADPKPVWWNIRRPHIQR